MKENSKQNSKSNVAKILKYAAAALSAVSFLTTLDGLTGIVVDNAWLAGLISFGIQAIILAMGLWFIPAITKIWGKKIKGLLRSIIIICMIVLYFCSIAFSSLFSYVFMSNKAYKDVRSTDYNMELELFLIDNTRTLRNYNDEVHDVLLENIRKTAPEFRTLLDESHEAASNKTKEIIEHVKLYETSTIPDSSKFSADDAIKAFLGVNEYEANAAMQETCRNYEADINQHATNYDGLYYPMYSQYYDDFKQQTETVSIDSRKKEIDNLITSLNNEITTLQTYNSPTNSIGNRITSACGKIINEYQQLIRALEDLKVAYEEIQNSPEVQQGEELTLQSFYEFVYSSDISDTDKLDNTREDLKKIVAACIENSDDITKKQEQIASLVECIEQLEKLSQCKNLRDEIEAFETTNLVETYDIIPDDQSKTGKQKTESEWKAARQEDVRQFITLVKSLPDINQIPGLDISAPDINQIPGLDVSAGESASKFLSELDENYISNTLTEAYKYSRAKLEEISKLERAWEYLSSEYNFLAILCLIIAVFLDLASFLIGLYLHISQDTPDTEKKPQQAAT